MLLCDGPACGYERCASRYGRPDREVSDQRTQATALPTSGSVPVVAWGGREAEALSTLQAKHRKRRAGFLSHYYAPTSWITKRLSC